MSGNPEFDSQGRDHLESASLYALQALSADEASEFEVHLSACPECRDEVGALQPVIDSFVSWPADVLRPAASLWGRLSRRICKESGMEPVALPPPRLAKPEWEEVGRGLFCKLLAINADTGRVTMLVRLEAGADYPSHRHGDVEELHVLHGEVEIDDKKFHAGDFIRAEAGSVDHRVWSETGCTCLLLASLNDTIL